MAAGSFYTLCWVKAEPPQSSWHKYDGPKGPYWEQNYDVIMQVGLTEMKAQIGWWENVSARLKCWRDMSDNKLPIWQGVEKRYVVL